MYAAGTVKDLIAEVEKTELLQVDSKGRSSDDRNYFGLVRSLVIGMRRMIASCDNYDARSGSKIGNTKNMVIGLLMGDVDAPQFADPDEFVCRSDARTKRYHSGY